MILLTKRPNVQPHDDDKDSHPLESSSAEQKFEESHPSGNSGSLRDEAFCVLPSNNVRRYITSEENSRLLRKIDRHVIPVLFIIYFLQLVDKHALSFSSVFGLPEDANLVGRQYSLLGSVTYIAELAMQPLSAFLLVKFRLSIYVPAIVSCWGVTLLCMSGARNFTGLLIARVFLGVFEASVQTSFILIIQFWYRRQEQGLRIAAWYSNHGWVNIIGSAVTFGLAHITSSALFTYQIIFLLLGAITFSLGLLSFFIFPENPVRSGFLTAEEKVIAVERLRANQQGIETKKFKPRHVIEMFLDPKSWCWMLLMFSVTLPAGGAGTFGPLIIKGFGFDGYNVMLLMIPFGALQVMFIFGGFWINNRIRLKSPFIILALVLPIVSTVILLRTGRSHQNQPLLLFAYYGLSTLPFVYPMIINWHTSNVAGHTKRSSSIAFMEIGSYAGSIVGPLIFSPEEKPYYRKGIISMLICFCISVVIVIMTVFYLRYLNGVNRMRRVRIGKGLALSSNLDLTAISSCLSTASEMVDYSMMYTTEIEKERDNHGDSSPDTAGAHAFDDLTDLENDEFIYVY